MTGTKTRGQVIMVTGTDTGVGKTIATAALAARLRDSGTVTVVKPVQTGISPERPEDRGDVDEIFRLTGCSAQEYTCLADPLAPETAARLRDVRIPAVSEYADRIRVLADFEDTVIVEGAGGVMVRLDTEGGTIVDLAAETDADVYVVCSAGLGTLNHTELTIATLRQRGLEPAGLIIGSWPVEPGLAEQCNREDLPRLTGVPVIATIPTGAGHLTQSDFLAQAPNWFSPRI